MARKPTYRYVPLKGHFVSIADGHKVSPRNVRRAFDAVMDKALASARRAAVQLDNETISPNEFAERMARLVRATHVVGAKLGAGTKRRARSAATRGRVEERLAFQMEKLTLFVDEAADGDIARGSLIRRAQMYVTSGTQTFEDERRRVVQGRGEMQYERRLINSSIPCGDCIGYSALGWQPIGTLPLPGQYCECMSACRCSFEYAEEIPAAQFAYDPNQPRDEQGQSRGYIGDDGSVHDSLRWVAETPKQGLRHAVGTWRIDDKSTWNRHGLAVEQLRMVKVADIAPIEDPYAMGRGEYVKVYAERLKAGSIPSPGYGSLRLDGRIQISDGHRRYYAYKEAGFEEMPLWVSDPSMPDEPRPDIELKHWVTSLTHRLAVRNALAAGKKVPAKVRALYPDLDPASDPAMYSRGVTDLPGQSRGEAHFMAKLGHNARRRLVEDALRAKVWKPTAEANAMYASSGGYVCDMFDDEVVYEDYKTGRKYRRSYTIGKDSDVTFGEASPVIESTQYVDAAFSGVPIDFSASVETSPGVRTGKIFEVGAWPEKNFALTPEEMAQAIEEFEPVPIDLEHKRTVFDGASSGAGIGRLSEIWAADSGRTLMGRVEFTDWAAKALHGVKLPVSCAWQYVKTASGDTAKKITKLSLTVDPAITDAELVAAFSAEPIERIAAVHKLFSGEHAHDINPAPTGAPTEGKPMTVATEPGAATKPESFAAKLFSLFKSATPEELAEVGAPMGAAFAGASAAAPAPAAAPASAAVVAESKAEADLKARIVALEAEARTEKAVNFTRSLIERGVILPAQAPALAGLYEQALKDDGDGTTVTFGKDKVGTRVQSIEAMFAEAPNHGLTKEHAETIKSGGAALLFADFGGKGGKCAPGMTKSAGMEEDEEEMDDEERMSLLGKSTLGKRAMSAKSKK